MLDCLSQVEDLGLFTRWIVGKKRNKKLMWLDHRQFPPFMKFASLTVMVSIPKISPQEKQESKKLDGPFF